jgi:soluble lytic murein transglycosylase-like protein
MVDRNPKPQTRTAVAAAAWLLCLAASAGPTGAAYAGESAAARSFSDGSRVPIHRVLTYRQPDGVTVFTDRVPANQAYTVMEFACYACNPRSTVDWSSTPLHTDKFTDLIADASRQHGVDSALVRALIHAESGFNPSARSHKGAFGLMQLMPGTARDLGVRDVTAVSQNIEGGVRYLAGLLQKFGGDITLATAAYNAGPGSVERYGGVPPFEETQTYVKRVRILHDRYKTQG